MKKKWCLIVMLVIEMCIRDRIDVDPLHDVDAAQVDILLKLYFMLPEQLFLLKRTDF